MSIQEYFKKMKDIHSNVLYFLDDETNVEENYQNLIQLLDDYKIREDRKELQMILYLLVKIADNHNRTPNFISKIEQILTNFKEDIQKYFTNFNIFEIFRNNKRLLLYFIREGLLTIDENIAAIMQSGKYSKKYYFYYFFPEIKEFNSNKELVQKLSEDMPDRFEDKRTYGVNFMDICRMIQTDSIDEFRKYVNENNFPQKTIIKAPVFETNSLLLKKDLDLIEYAAFYGSTRIFEFIQSKKEISIKPSIWTYAIHGGKIEIIKMLESEKIEFEDKSCEKYLKEAIRCHHNIIANYFLHKYMKDQIEVPNYIDNNFNENYISYAFHYYNFSMLPNEINQKFIFLYSCKYDIFNLVKLFLKNKEMENDPNLKVI